MLITGIVWSLADMLTAFLLLAQFRVKGSLLFGFLSAAYGLSAILTWPYLAVFPGLFPTDGAVSYTHLDVYKRQFALHSKFSVRAPLEV